MKFKKSILSLCALYIASSAMLSSCVYQTTIPLGTTGHIDARKLNDMSSGQRVWINNEAMTEPPVTVRWALDSFFVLNADGTSKTRSYNDVHAISFRYKLGGGKVGAIAGGALGGIAGTIFLYSNLPDINDPNYKPGDFYLAAYTPYIGAALGAGVGFLVGYMIGTEEHFFLVH